MGKKPKSNPVSNIPTATPIRDNGSMHRIMIGWRKLPNNATRITTSIKNARGKNLAIACIASPWSLYWASQKKLYPSGNSIASISSRISPCTSAMVCPGFTPHMAAMDNWRLYVRICGNSQVVSIFSVTCDRGAECSPFQTGKSPKDWTSVIWTPSDFSNTGTFFSLSR